MVSPEDFQSQELASAKSKNDLADLLYLTEK